MTQGVSRDFSAQYGYQFEELSVGMTAEYSKTVTEADIVLFAGISGDTNPVHLDEEFAASTMFGGRIAHGMLSAAFVSAALGTRLPGPGSIYVSQTLAFRAPVKIGDTVVTRVTVKALNPEKRRVTLTTDCFVKDVIVMRGEAEILIPARK